MSELKRIVYLSNEQAQTLFDTGSVTSNGITVNYDENDLYVTPDTQLQADWEQTVTTADDYIKNKPTTLAGYSITDAKIANGVITLGSNTITPLTAHQTYTQFTGKPTGNQTPAFGGTFTIQQISQSTTGQVSGTDRTVTIPATIATNTAVGLVKPWYTHTAASTGPTTGTNATAITVNTITTTSGKYYAVEADSNGRLFVNVPWSDSNSDVNVTQAAAITTAGAYPVILANSTATTAVTGSVNKTSTLTYNPNTKALVTGGTVNGYTLAAASAKGVDTSISATSTSTNLPTSAAVATLINSKQKLLSFSITTSNWTSSAGLYVYAISDSFVTENTAAIVNMNNSYDFLLSNLQVITGSGTVTFSTETVPSNTISGVLVLQK